MGIKFAQAITATFVVLIEDAYMKAINNLFFLLL